MDEEIYSAAVEGMEAGAADYAERFAAVSGTAFADERALARKDAAELLEASRGLSRVDAALTEHPRLLRVARASCAPPLTKDKLGGIATIQAYRLTDMEDGVEPRTVLQRRKAAAEVELLTQVVDRFLDRGIAPWLGTGCEPSAEQAALWVEVVADRAACASGEHSSTRKMAADLLGRLENWLRTRGYHPAAKVCGPATYSALDATDGFLVAPKGGERPVVLGCKVCPDHANALRLAKRDAQPLLDIAEETGAMPVQVIAGLIREPYVKRMSEVGVPVVWAHELDRLDRLGV
ncbi:MAG: XamI family restriction endonuclease [Coriobacteriales bacterium]